MRYEILLLGLVACDSYQPPTYGVCNRDAECSVGVICARSGECLDPAAVIPPFTVSWRLDGSPPTAATCARHPVLKLVFVADNAADADLVLELPCTGSGRVIDRIPEHLMWLDQELGPADVPNPEEFPNKVGWSTAYLGVTAAGHLEFDLDGF